MKKTLLVFIFLKVFLYAATTDSLLINGSFQKVYLIKKDISKELNQKIWDEYLEDMDFFMTFESPDQVNKSNLYRYCERKYLKEFGISRLDFDKYGDFLIQENILSSYIDRYFNIKNINLSTKNVNLSVSLGENYLKKDLPTHRLSYIELYTQDIVKAYVNVFIDNSKEIERTYTAYLKKRADNTYYFLCIREVYNLNKKKRMTDKSLELSINENVIELDQSKNVVLNCSFIKEYNNLYYFYRIENQDNQQLYKVYKCDKESLSLVDSSCFNFNIGSFEWQSYPDIDFDLHNNGYNLIYQAEQDTLIIKKRPYTIKKKTVNSVMQTFVNYYEDLNKDKTLAVYVDWQGVILYDIVNDKELCIKPYIGEGGSYYQSPKFIDNDKKVIFFEVGDEYYGPVYIYDIIGKKLKESKDYRGNYRVIFTPYGVVSLHDGGTVQKSFIEILDFDLKSTILPIEGSVEYYPSIAMNNEYLAFSTISEKSKKTMYALNLKSKTVSKALFSDICDSISIQLITPDNRIIFHTRDINFNLRYYITKSGVLK